MHNLLIIFLLIVICFLSLRNIQIGFAMIFAVDLIMPRAVTFMEILPTREIFMLIAWSFFLYHGVIKKEYKLTFIGIYSKPLFFLFTCTFIILVFSSGQVEIGMQLKHIFSLIYYLSYAYIAWIIYNDKKGIRQFYRIIFAVAIIMAVYGIFCYIIKSNPYILMLETSANTNIIAGMEEIRGGLEGRIQSTMTHPITWGITSCLFLLFFLGKRNNSIEKYILLILLFVNLFLSGSRSALIALFISLFYILICKRNIKLLLSSIFAVAITTIIILYTPVLQSYKGLIESTVFFWDDSISRESDIQGSSVAMRTMQFLGVLEIIQDNFLFGLGHGYVNYYSSTFGSHPLLLGFESLIFNKLVEGGIVGLLLWLYLFFILFRNIGKLNKRLQSRQNVSTIKAYVILYFVFSLFTGFMETFLYFIVIYAVLIKSMIINTDILHSKSIST